MDDADAKENWHKRAVGLRGCSRGLPPHGELLQYFLRVAPRLNMLWRIWQFLIETRRHDTLPLKMIRPVVEFHTNVWVFAHARDLLSQQAETV